MLRSIGKLCVSFSAVRDRELSVPVLADVWRRRTRNSHIRRRTLDGPAREEIPPDEDRRRGTRSVVLCPYMGSVPGTITVSCQSATSILDATQFQSINLLKAKGPIGDLHRSKIHDKIHKHTQTHIIRSNSFIIRSLCRFR